MPELDQIQLVSLLGLRPKVGLRVVRCTCCGLEQTLSTLVHFPHAELSKSGGPRVVISAHSGNAVAQDNKLFIATDDADGGFVVLFSGLLCLRWG